MQLKINLIIILTFSLISCTFDNQNKLSNNYLEKKEESTTTEVNETIIKSEDTNIVIEEKNISNNDIIEKYRFIHKHWVKNNKTYNILKYDKNFLTCDMIDQIGLFRSVIYSNNKINCFSPPKSLNISI